MRLLLIGTLIVAAGTLAFAQRTEPSGWTKYNADNAAKTRAATSAYRKAYAELQVCRDQQIRLSVKVAELTSLLRKFDGGTRQAGDATLEALIAVVSSRTISKQEDTPKARDAAAAYRQVYDALQVSRDQQTSLKASVRELIAVLGVPERKRRLDNEAAIDALIQEIEKVMSESKP